MVVGRRGGRLVSGKRRPSPAPTGGGLTAPFLGRLGD